MSLFPERIICLTEESVEIIFALNEQSRIVGVSAFVERPIEAKKIPVVSSFIKADIQKIKDLKPDLVIGHSDVQKDIAKELISEGLNVFIANHRSLKGIMDYTAFLARMFERIEQGKKLIQIFNNKINEAKNFATTHAPLKIYLEEWDEPLISASLWWSEIFELLGAKNLFSSLASNPKALDRQVNWQEVVRLNPDIMAFCWCGKKTNFDSIARRDNILQVNAFAKKHIIDLDPTIFLQPGPAVFLEGIDKAKREIEKIINSD